MLAILLIFPAVGKQRVGECKVEQYDDKFEDVGHETKLHKLICLWKKGFFLVSEIIYNYLCDMGAVFRFKQFEVDQTGCAMKINTDGVLLGAIERDIAPSCILDIGTGTGVVALMLAQAFPQARIDAVEIDVIAAQQAQLNFERSPFATRLQLFESSFQAFNPIKCYDLIVSNPPFYTHSLHTPDARKKLAKHTDMLFFEQLLHYVDGCLSTNGNFECIVPAVLADWMVEEARAKYRLHCQRRLDVSSFPNGEIIRSIVTFGRGSEEPTYTYLYIYEKKGLYSTAYKHLLKPYFLAY